jgi:hypothetical protein
MIHQPVTSQTAMDLVRRGSATDPHIPLWRRITALFTLAALVVVIGLVVAAVVASGALLALFVLERAISG